MTPPPATPPAYRVFSTEITLRLVWWETPEDLEKNDGPGDPGQLVGDMFCNQPSEYLWDFAQGPTVELTPEQKA